MRRASADEGVERIARGLFPDGILIDADDPVEAAERTRQAVASGCSTIFRALVRTGRGLLARAAILTRTGDRWILNTVRATTSIKSEHIAEAAFETIAFSESGFEIAAVRLVHLDRRFRRQGEPAADRLLAVTDITGRVHHRTEAIKAEIDRARAVIEDPHVPGMCLCDMGTRAQRCPTFGYFHPTLPSGNTIYELGGITGKTVGEAIARGVVHLADWPDDLELLPRQRRQVDAARLREAYLDRDWIGRLLAGMQYPLHFLDYETFQTAVPLFDGCGPWSQVPFQYSVHVVERDGQVRHHEFLWTDRQSSPVPALVRQLQQDIGLEGSVVVWNQGFEEPRNRELAGLVPGAADFLYGVNDRMVDLMDVVRLGHWVDPGFDGSSSIKRILPVIAPELAYQFLEIQDGAQASRRWFEAVLGDPAGMTDAERENVFAALRVYCQHDTLALVRIWQFLDAVAGTPGDGQHQVRTAAD